MKYKTLIIIKEATQIKSFMEKYKRIPKACTIGNTTVSPYSAAYLLSKIVRDDFLNNEVNLAGVIAYNAERHNDTINEKVYKKDYLIMIKNFVNFCVDHKRVPAYITTQKSRTKVSFELYLYCLSKIVNYYKENKTLPNYCTFNKLDLQNTKTDTANTKKKVSKSTSSKTNNNKSTTRFVSEPHYTSHGCNNLGQCTPYYCGPHSIHQAIRKFGITKYDEKQIAAYAGTTTRGSSHDGINTAIAKISKATGIKLTIQWKNFSDMGKTDAERFKNIGKLLSDKNTAIIWHIGYANGGESTTGKMFGHYEVLNVIDTLTNYVKALNSLGTRKADGSYVGKLQDRKFNVQAYFARKTPGNQAALCIIRKG